MVLLDLSGNQITGSLPDSFGQGCQSLNQLALYSNRLAGEIPPGRSSVKLRFESVHMLIVRPQCHASSIATGLHYLSFWHISLRQQHGMHRLFLSGLECTS